MFHACFYVKVFILIGNLNVLSILNKLNFLYSLFALFVDSKVSLKSHIVNLIFKDEFP